MPLLAIVDFVTWVELGWGKQPDGFARQGWICWLTTEICDNREGLPGLLEELDSTASGVWECCPFWLINLAWGG